jgi:hypothetical protein
MHDKMFEGFLRRQQQEGEALARESDVLELLPKPEEPPQCYIARFSCKGLVRDESGRIGLADTFAVGIRFPWDYLRRADALEVITWLGPANVFHPNISPVAPVICLGRLTPGTGLVDILYRVFEIITYNKATIREDDALNPDACAWARSHPHRIPVDDRPLKRRAPSLHIETTELSR